MKRLNPCYPGLGGLKHGRTVGRILDFPKYQDVGRSVEGLQYLLEFVLSFIVSSFNGRNSQLELPETPGSQVYGFDRIFNIDSAQPWVDGHIERVKKCGLPRTGRTYYSYIQPVLQTSKQKRRGFDGHVPTPCKCSESQGVPANLPDVQGKTGVCNRICVQTHPQLHPS